MYAMVMYLYAMKKILKNHERQVKNYFNKSSADPKEVSLHNANNRSLLIKLLMKKLEKNVF